MSKKSKDKIAMSLLLLLQEHSFHEITISEICAWGKIARRTFYNNFSNKEEILVAMSRWIIDESIVIPLKHQKGDIERQWLESLFANFFLVNKQYHDFFTVLFAQHLYHIYTQELHRVIEISHKKFQQEMTVFPEALYPYIIPSYTSALLEYYKIWWGRDYKETPEELAKLFIQMIYCDPPSTS